MDINNQQNLLRQIVEKIGDGSWKEGDRLPSEREMCQMFDVSRETLRETISVLKMLEVIEVEPTQGMYLRKLQIFPLIQIVSPLLITTEGNDNTIYELRRLLEHEAVRLACNRAEDFSILKTILDSMKELKNTEANYEDMAVDLDISFHREIFRLANSNLLLTLMESMENVLDYTVGAYRRKRLEAGRNHEIFIKEHEAIYDALVKGDETKAVALTIKHLSLD